MAKKNDIFCFDKKFLIVSLLGIGAIYFLFKDNKDDNCNCNK